MDMKDVKSVSAPPVNAPVAMTDDLPQTVVGENQNQKKNITSELRDELKITPNEMAILIPILNFASVFHGPLAINQENAVVYEVIPIFCILSMFSNILISKNKQQDLEQKILNPLIRLFQDAIQETKTLLFQELLQRYLESWRPRLRPSLILEIWIIDIQRLVPVLFSTEEWTLVLDRLASVKRWMEYFTTSAHDVRLSKSLWKLLPVLCVIKLFILGSCAIHFKQQPLESELFDVFALYFKEYLKVAHVIQPPPQIPRTINGRKVLHQCFLLLNVPYWNINFAQFVFDLGNFLVGFDQFVRIRKFETAFQQIQTHIQNDRLLWQNFLEIQPGNVAFGVPDTALLPKTNTPYLRQSNDFRVWARWFMSDKDFEDWQDAAMTTKTILSNFLFPNSHLYPSWQMTWSMTQRVNTKQQNEELWEFIKEENINFEKGIVKRSYTVPREDPFAVTPNKRDFEWHEFVYHPSLNCFMSPLQFKDIVPELCMSFDMVDLYILENDQKEEFTFGEATGKFQVPMDEKAGTFVFTQTALSMLGNEFCFPTMKRYRCFRYGTPEHIAVLLWDIEQQRLEFFDSGGTQTTESIFPILKFFRAVPQAPRFVNVNARTNLQQQEKETHDKDEYCQTYIYYFLYQRVRRGLSADQIITGLERMSPANRITLMRQFNDFLLYDTSKVKRSFVPAVKKGGCKLLLHDF